MALNATADLSGLAAFRTNKTPPTAQKVRGGYYTPRELADYLCRWAIRGRSDRVLEPSCGDGSFVRAASPLLGAEGAMTAVEIVPEEIEKARNNAAGVAVPIDWRCGSFFDVVPELLGSSGYDAAVGNPPFIRFQYFDRDAREQAFQIVRSFGYKPNGLANAWVAFVQLSAELLRDGGRLAMVVPAELLQVQYAAELRDRLPKLFDDVHVVAFNELVFPGIQQEVLLLLCEGRNRGAGAYGRLHTLEVGNGEALLALGPGNDLVSHLPERHTHEQMKWTSLFLEDGEFATLRDVARQGILGRLGSLADVDVGIVTGRNGFFVVSEADAERFGLDGRAVDVVGRTGALKSLRFTESDLRRYAESNRSKLLDLTGSDRSLFSPALADYVRLGEEQGVHLGYKCRIRRRWFDVPSVYAPDAFLYRQIHHAPLLVANTVGATATDTIHRVRVADTVDVEVLCASMVNSLTFAWAEVCGRSYGGGVLELEPREAEELLVPYATAGNLDVDYLDGKVRRGDLDAALDHGDGALFDAGLSSRDVRRARAAWNRLRGRRQRRKHRRAAKRPRTEETGVTQLALGYAD